jgi:acetoin utilization deacetylase AcuC-like enzyme
MSEQRCAARLVYRREYENYDFGAEHPLRPVRIRASLDLLSSLGIGPTNDQQLESPTASIEDLTLIHTPRYVDAVQSLDAFADDPLLAAELSRWGLGPGDSPAFVGMHPAAALIAGGTLHAIRGVLNGAFLHAFHPAGGLHHALRDRASGFCIYNDAAIAIAAALQEREARVLYLDFDAHHGDGVQTAFYDEPRVLTFSIHETGRHLFPGTSFLHELGEGLGRGYSLNLPVEPFTEDDSWLEALGAPQCVNTFSAVLPNTARLRPPRPCVRITIRSTACSRTSLTISSAGSPTRTVASTWIPATTTSEASSARSALAAPAASRSPCRRWSATTRSSLTRAFVADANVRAIGNAALDSGVPSSGTRIFVNIRLSPVRPWSSSEVADSVAGGECARCRSDRDATRAALKRELRNTLLPDGWWAVRN